MEVGAIGEWRANPVPTEVMGAAVQTEAMQWPTLLRSGRTLFVRPSRAVREAMAERRVHGCLISVLLVRRPRSGAHSEASRISPGVRLPGHAEEQLPEAERRQSG
jgi:hypothetical protein